VERDESIDIDFKAGVVRYLKEGPWKTQAAFAKFAGVSGSSLSDVKNGNRYGSEHYRTAMARAAGFPSLESFREYGRGEAPSLSPPSPNLLPFNRRKTDDSELTPILEKIVEIWGWVKDNPEQKEKALWLLQTHYEGFKPKPYGKRKQPGK
jgi:transcriptional regulator with XRE-family HTH domain